MIDKNQGYPIRMSVLPRIDSLAAVILFIMWWLAFFTMQLITFILEPLRLIVFFLATLPISYIGVCLYRMRLLTRPIIWKYWHFLYVWKHWSTHVRKYSRFECKCQHPNDDKMPEWKDCYYYVVVENNIKILTSIYNNLVEKSKQDKIDNNKGSSQLKKNKIRIEIKGIPFLRQCLMDSFRNLVVLLQLLTVRDHKNDVRELSDDDNSELEKTLRDKIRDHKNDVTELRKLKFVCPPTSSGDDNSEPKEMLRDKIKFGKMLGDKIKFDDKKLQAPVQAIGAKIFSIVHPNELDDKNDLLNPLRCLEDPNEPDDKNDLLNLLRCLEDVLREHCKCKKKRWLLLHPVESLLADVKKKRCRKCKKHGLNEKWECSECSKAETTKNEEIIPRLQKYYSMFVSSLFTSQNLDQGDTQRNEELPDHSYLFLAQKPWLNDDEQEVNTQAELIEEQLLIGQRVIPTFDHFSYVQFPQVRIQSVYTNEFPEEDAMQTKSRQILFTIDCRGLKYVEVGQEKFFKGDLKSQERYLEIAPSDRKRRRCAKKYFKMTRIACGNDGHCNCSYTMIQNIKERILQSRDRRDREISDPDVDADLGINFKCAFTPKYTLDTTMYHQSVVDDLFFWGLGQMTLFLYNRQANESIDSTIELVAVSFVSLSCVVSLVWIVYTFLGSKNNNNDPQRSIFDIYDLVDVRIKDPISWFLGYIFTDAEGNELVIAKEEELAPEVILRDAPERKNKDDDSVDQEFLKEWRKYLVAVREKEESKHEILDKPSEDAETSSLSSLSNEVDLDPDDQNALTSYLFLLTTMVESYTLEEGSELCAGGDFPDIWGKFLGSGRMHVSKEELERNDKSLYLLLKVFLCNSQSQGVNVDYTRPFKMEDFLAESWKNIAFEEFDDHENSLDEDEEDLINDHTDFRMYNLVYNRLQYEWNKFICFICFSDSACEDRDCLQEFTISLLVYLQISCSEGVMICMDRMEDKFSELWENYQKEIVKVDLAQFEKGDPLKLLKETKLIFPTPFIIFRNLFLRNAIFRKMKQDARPLVKFYTSENEFRKVSEEEKNVLKQIHSDREEAKKYCPYLCCTIFFITPLTLFIAYLVDSMIQEELGLADAK